MQHNDNAKILTLLTQQCAPIISFSLHSHYKNSQNHTVAFDKFELNYILNLYSRKVSNGDWKDYTIDCLKNKAVFAIFRKHTDVPLYRIEKTPEYAKKQGQYSLHSAGGVVLKRGHNLETVLKYFAEKPKLV